MTSQRRFRPASRPSHLSHRSHRSRGLTLIECAVALVIVALAITLVLQTDIGTTDSAIHSRNSQLAAMLANEIMAREAMGVMPQQAGDVVQIGPERVDRNDPRFSDQDTEFFPYADFEFEVIKRIVEISDDADLSRPQDEWDDGPYGEVPPEGEEMPTVIEVVQIEVRVLFPTSEQRATTESRAGGGRPMDEVALETYVFDVVRRDAERSGETEAQPEGR